MLWPGIVNESCWIQITLNQGVLYVCAECPLKNSLIHFSPFLPWQYACCGQSERTDHHGDTWFHHGDTEMSIEDNQQSVKLYDTYGMGQTQPVLSRNLGFSLAMQYAVSVHEWFVYVGARKLHKMNMNIFEYLWISVAARQSHSRKRTVGIISMCEKKPKCNWLSIFAMQQWH